MTNVNSIKLKGLGEVLLDKIYRKFRVVRKAYGLKQADIALLLGININTIRRYEAGLRTPDLEFIVRFITVFKVSPEWFLSSANTPYEISDKTTNGDMKELLYFAYIPEIKRGLLAELDKLKTIFEAKITAYEKSLKADQRSVLEKRKENIHEILKVLRKQKTQGKKKAGKGLLGYDMLTGKAKKAKKS